jgi:hypothetical protein
MPQRPPTKRSRSVTVADVTLSAHPEGARIVARRATVLFAVILAGGVLAPAVPASAAVAPLAVIFTVNSFQDRPDANLADNICRTSA